MKELLERPGEQDNSTGGQPTVQAGPSSDDKLFGAGAHVSLLMGGLVFHGLGSVIVPIGLYLFFRDKSQFVADHAKQSAGMSIVAAILGICYWSLSLMSFGVLGVLLLPVVFVVGITMLVLVIKGASAALNGHAYTYPLIGQKIAKF